MNKNKLPPKEDWVVAGWPNPGVAVALENKPPVAGPAGFELNSGVPPPKTGVAPVPKLVVAIGLPKADWPKGLFCVDALKPINHDNLLFIAQR